MKCNMKDYGSFHEDNVNADYDEDKIKTREQFNQLTNTQHAKFQQEKMISVKLFLKFRSINVHKLVTRDVKMRMRKNADLDIQDSHQKRL